MNPKIICLTPIKNEAWILRRFLTCASLWADHIIIADQHSSDGSREIAKEFSKVILINNDSPVFNEPERQKLLINEARKISGPKLLVALDADEIFSPDAWNTAEWRTMLAAKPGTVIKFCWANISPRWNKMWMPSYDFPFGYMDDGADHHGAKIHSTRIPCPISAHAILMNEVKVLHLQFTDWERMKSKHRWYQCWELINNPRKSPVRIFRQYHHMYGIPENEKIDIPAEWKREYEKAAIDLTTVFQENMLWWDRDVLDCFDKYGVLFFKKLNIWDTNWADQAKKWDRPNPALYRDPRSWCVKVIHKLLQKTQPSQTLSAKILDWIVSFVF